MLGDLAGAALSSGVPDRLLFDGVAISKQDSVETIITVLCFLYALSHAGFFVVLLVAPRTVPTELQLAVPITWHRPESATLRLGLIIY